MATCAMRIARTKTDMFAVANSGPVDPVTWKISAITATNAAMVICLEKNLATRAGRSAST